MAAPKKAERESETMDTQIFSEKLKLFTAEMRERLPDLPLPPALKEAAEGWSTQLERIGDQVEKRISDVQVQVNLGLMEGRETIEKVRTQAQSIISTGPLAQVAVGPRKIVDEVKVRAQLGLMEARDLATRGREEIERTRSRVTQQSELVSKRLNKSLGRIMSRFS